MPELPPYVWLVIILGSVVITGVDSVKTKWHYRHSPSLGCHKVVQDASFCYHDERDGSVPYTMR